MAMLPTLVGAIFVVLLMVGEAYHLDPLRYVAKPAASLAFIVQAYVSGALAAGPAGIAVLVALGLSFFGDVCLLSREKPAFLAGIIGFLLGHVAYAAAFLSLGLSSIGVVSALALHVPLGIGLWRWLGPSTGKLKPAVFAYLAVISTMAVFAAGAMVADPQPVRIALWVAALVFMFSDLCVARDRFVQREFINRAVGLPTYYAAQFAFAVAIGAS